MKYTDAAAFRAYSKIPVAIFEIGDKFRELAAPILHEKLPDGIVEVLNKVDPKIPQWIRQKEQH